MSGAADLFTEDMFRPVNVLRYAVTTALAGPAIGRPGPVNTDANAYIETRMPLLPKSAGASLNKNGGSAFTGLLPQSFTALDESSFRALYARMLIEWTKRPAYLSALQWYCEARGRQGRAKAVKGVMALQESNQVPGSRQIPEASQTPICRFRRNFAECERIRPGPALVFFGHIVIFLV